MSFRLRIVLMTTLLISLLFSAGGTMLIHTSFQNSLEKEQEALGNANEMILRMVQYVGKVEDWISEEKLISIISNLYQQDTIHTLRLVHEGENIYTCQNGTFVESLQGFIRYEESRHRCSKIFFCCCRW